MRKTVMVLGLLGVLAQPALALAQDTTVEKTKTETTYTNPVSEVVLLPVRLVTGVIGAPIGAITGIFTGFAKGFQWPGHAATVETTTTTKNKD
jgi:hypothetical protein